MRTSDFACPKKNSPHAHEKQTLVNHVSKGVGDGSVNRKVGTNADAHDHKSDLVNFTVTKDASKIILDYGIKNGKHRHDPPDYNQNLGSRKQAGEHTNGALCGKSAKPDRTRRSRLRIPILKPNVQTGKGGFDTYCEQNHEGSRISGFQFMSQRD